jgi:DNA polymerase-3 subunit alpha
MAMTDHGNCNGHSYAFLKSQKMKKEGRDDFRVLYGIEAYVHPSISSWKMEKEQYALDKKLSKDIDDDKGLTIEDEGETKKGIRNPLNKRGHLVLIAQNNIGLQNIYKLTSKSYSGDNFYRYPRMDYEMLKKHSEGVIATQACIGSIAALPFWSKREEGDSAILAGMEEVYGNLLDIFGDRFYGELQWANNPDQHRINQFTIQLSKQLGFQLVSTVDSHYPSPDKWKDREVYKMLGWLNKKSDIDIGSLPNTLDDMQYQLYPKNGDELYASYKRTAQQQGFFYDDNLILESIERTADILKNRIEKFEIDTSIKLPSFVVPDGETADSALLKMALQGFKDLDLHKDQEYVNRLKRELSFVREKKFSHYFLTTKSLVDLAKDKMLCGIARGSASGSLLAYCLGITQIDSVKYKLPFERFLNNAGGFPDIDMDFAYNDKMKEIMVEKFGKDNVAYISNFNTLQLKSLIKDVSKLYQIPFQEVNEVTSRMLDEATPEAKKKHGINAGVYDPTYEELKEFSPTFKTFLAKYPDVGQNITNLLDNVRNYATHAAGMIVCDDLASKMPLIVRDGVNLTPWAEGQNVRHLEPFGYIKMDILGLKTLRLFEMCITNILKSQGMKDIKFEDIKRFYDNNLSVEAIDFDDQRVYQNVFQNHKWTGGIFQFTEEPVQKFCNEVKPTNIEELSAITSIFRPGPLSSKVDRQYLEAKQNPQNIKYDHPIIEEVLKKNYGLLVFQEDISTITSRLGKDISPDEGQEFRKVLTKKGLGGKEVEVKERIKDKFVSGCLEKGLSMEKALEIYQKMEYFAQYSFSKCLHGDTLVETQKGLKRLSEVVIGDSVNSKNGFVTVKNTYTQGKKKTYKVKTSSGKEIIATLDHKFETEFGMKTLGYIVKNKLKIITKR